MEGIGCEVTSPIQSTVIVPDREDVFCPGGNFFHLSKHLAHKDFKVLGWITIDSTNLSTLLLRELIHESFHYIVGVFVELLEIVTEVSHDVC